MSDMVRHGRGLCRYRMIVGPRQGACCFSTGLLSARSLRCAELSSPWLALPIRQVWSGLLFSAPIFSAPTAVQLGLQSVRLGLGIEDWSRLRTRRQ